MESVHKGVLVTDLYELTMLQGYFDSGMDDTAVFEFFVREMPPGHGYLVACGLELVLDYLQELRFNDQDLAWMRKNGRFSEAFVDYLKSFRFRGDVHAMPEGSIFFRNEPILRVTAPIAQAQLVETRIINLLQYNVLVATKAARCVGAAPQKQLVDFGLRRAHGAEAGLMAARASYIAGFDGTSNVLAGKECAIPVSGTMAHSFIQAHDREEQAFLNFARAQPDNVVLLIDTYDTEEAARKLGKLAKQLKDQHIDISAVRLDSGDLSEHAYKVRDILDSNGLTNVKIFASGSIDEYKLAQLLDSRVPIDGFGVGSKLATSADAPYLDCAYKLVEYAEIPRRKYSEEKATLPGRKQVFRFYDDRGNMYGDVIGLGYEDTPSPHTDEQTQQHNRLSVDKLLQPVMSAGKNVAELKPLEGVREYHQAQLGKIPAAIRAIDTTKRYPVTVSRALHELEEKTKPGRYSTDKNSFVY